MQHPESFYDLDAGDWFDATGEKQPTGYDYPEKWRPIYKRRSDGARGWFPSVGSRFKPLPA